MLHNLRNRISKKGILISSLLLVIFVMSLGYAALSQHIDIDGIAQIDRSWIIKITNVTSSVIGDGVDEGNTYLGATATMHVKLPSSSSKVTYTLTLENQGNINAKLGNIEKIDDDNSGITYKIEGVVENETVLKPGESNTVVVTFQYQEGVTSISDIEKDLMLTFNYIEYGSSNNSSGGTDGSTNSGDSSSSLENRLFLPGDAITLDPGDGVERLFHVITTNDSIEKDTVELVYYPNEDQSYGYPSVLFANYESNYSSWTKAVSVRLLSLTDIGNVAGFEVISGNDYSDVTLEEWISAKGTSIAPYLLTTMNGDNYYAIDVDGSIITITPNTDAAMRIVIEVNKSELPKYNEYNLGDKVLLVNNKVGYVVKDSGNSNAMVSIYLQENLLDAHVFDSTGSVKYDSFSNTNIGYYIQEYVPLLKSYINENNGNSTATTARLITKSEAEGFINRGVLVPYSSLTMTAASSTNIYVYGNNSIDTLDTVTNYDVNPVVTVLKENVSPVELVRKILHDNKEKTDENVDFTQSSEVGLYYTNTNTEDNQTTYYYRGNVNNNYLQFDGSSTVWRIVRINEDGTVRIVTENNILTGAYSIAGGHSYLVGYMYGDDPSGYIGANSNKNASFLKIQLDSWYATNMSSFVNYIADSGFCNDRSVASEAGVWHANDTALGYGVETTYYGAYNRLYNEKQPQFKCPNPENDLFTTTTSGKGNKVLTYPVGLLTADEIVYAGGIAGEASQNNYLNNNTSYFTFSPFAFDESLSGITGGAVFGNTSGKLEFFDVENSFGIRPVVNLKKKVELIRGNGTSSTPYIIS